MKVPMLTVNQEEWVCRLAVSLGCEFIICVPATKPHTMIPHIVSAENARQYARRLERIYGKDAIVVIELEEMVAQ